MDSNQTTMNMLSMISDWTSQNKLNEKDKREISQLYINLKYKIDKHKHKKDNKQTEDKEMMNYYTMGWYIYKFLLHSDS